MDVTKQKQTHRCREQTSGYQQGEGRGLIGTNYYVKISKLQGYMV